MMLRRTAFLWLMLGVASHAIADQPFSPQDVLSGTSSTPALCEGVGGIWVEVGGEGDCLRFYGAVPGGVRANPVIFLEGDVVQQQSIGRDSAASEVKAISWEIVSVYAQRCPATMQAESE